MRFLSLERSQHPVILPNAAPWVPFIGSLPLPRYRRLYSFIGEIVSRSLGAIQLCYLLHGSPITRILILQLYLHGSPLGAIRICYLLHGSAITKIMVLQLLSDVLKRRIMFLQLHMKKPNYYLISILKNLHPSSMFYLNLHLREKEKY